MTRTDRLLRLCAFIVLTGPFLVHGEPPVGEAKPKAAAPGKGGRTDLYGDPLPEGAVARLGTVRFRARSTQSVVFSPDGKTVAAGYSDFTIRIWETATGREVRRITGFRSNDVACVGFSPDGKRLFSHDSEDGLRAWDLTTDKEVPKPFDTGPVSPDFLRTPDGKARVTTDGRGSIRVLDSAGKVLRTMGESNTGSLLALAPDGKTIAAKGKDGTTLCLWDATTGKALHQLKGHDKELLCLTFSPDSKRLLSGGNDRTARVWDVESGKQLHRFYRPEPHCHYNVFGAWSPDGKTLALAGWDGVLRLYDAVTYKERFDFGGHHGWITTLAVSPDGRRVVTASEDRTVRLWDAANGKELRILGEGSNFLYSVAWSPDGRTVALASLTGEVRRWDATTGKELSEFRAEKHRPWRVAFSPAGDLLASVDATVCLWDAASGKLLRRLPGDHMAEGLAFSPDGRFLATGSQDHLIRLWDVASGKEVCRFAGHDNWVEHVAFSPDGRTLVSTSSDWTIRLWELATSRERGRLGGKQRMTTPIAFSPDGRFLAWGGRDRLVHVHSFAEDKEVRRFVGHDGEIASLAYSPNGKRLFSASYDTTALVWDVAGIGGGRAEMKRLTADEAVTLWRDLQGDDGAKAYRAIWQLAASPNETLPLVREVLKPAAVLDGARLMKLIADLDDEDFAVREKATKELEQAGDQAEPELRKVLKGKSSAEVIQRTNRF